MNISNAEIDALRGRVLVVEDASVFREMQSLLMRKAGYEIVACESLDSALLEATRQTFDIIFLNSDSPGIDSADFLGKLRQLRPTPAILFMAAMLTVELTRELSRLGVAAVLQRPVNPQILIQKLDELSGAPAAPTPTNRYVVASPKVAPTRPLQADFAARHKNTNDVKGSVSPFPPAASNPPFSAGKTATPFRPESAVPFSFGSAAPFTSSPFATHSVSPFGSVLRR